MLIEQTDERLVVDALDVEVVILLELEDDEVEHLEIELLDIKVEVTVIDEIDERDFVDLDDEVLVLEDIEIEVQLIDEVGQSLMQLIIDDDDEVEGMEGIIDNDVNELCLFAIKQMVAVDLALPLDEIVVILATDIVYIDLHLTEHLLLLDSDLLAIRESKI